MTKQTLRTEMKKRRQSLTPAEIQSRSDRICRQLAALPAYQNAKTIVLYAAAFGEANPAALLPALWESGKTVCLPKCMENPRTLQMLTLPPAGKLIPGAYGILIPADGEILAPAEIDFVVVPGIAFDRQGARVGFGAGYYDRFLSQSQAVKVGFCYDFQVVETVDTAPHDVRMDYIVTESELIFCGKGLSEKLVAGADCAGGTASDRDLDCCSGNDFRS